MANRKYTDPGILVFGFIWGLLAYFLGRFIVEALSYIKIIVDWIFKILLWFITLPSEIINTVFSKISFNPGVIITLIFVVIIAILLTPLLIGLYEIIKKILRELHF